MSNSRTLTFPFVRSLDSLLLEFVRYSNYENKTDGRVEFGNCWMHKMWRLLLRYGEISMDWAVSEK